MGRLGEALSEAVGLLTGFEREVAEIVMLSLRVSLSAVLMGTLIGLPLGACLAVGRFPGKHAMAIVINGCMGLPSVLVVPLMAAIARQVVEDAWRGYAEELAAMRFSWWQSVSTLLHDCRYSLLVAILAGLGRAMSEVVAVMVVGGNIDRATRVMTTAIALETSKGDLPLSIALGMVLLAVILAINGLAFVLRTWAAARFG